MVAIDLLKDVMLRANISSSARDVTTAIIKLDRHSDRSAVQSLFDAAVGVVDEYLTQGEEDSIFSEKAFKDRSDLGAVLKWEQLGKGEYTPRFASLMAINKRTMGRGSPSPRDLITLMITS